MTTLKAVFETHSRDCDGPLSDGYTLHMTEEEKTGNFGDIDFHHRVLGFVVNTYSGLGGTLTVTKDEDDGWTRLSWHEPTDEGYRAVEATISSVDDDEDTDDEHHWHRDHAAEAMGY